MRHCRCDSARRVDRPSFTHQRGPARRRKFLCSAQGPFLGPDRLPRAAGARSQTHDWPKASAEGTAVLTAAGACCRDGAEPPGRQFSPYRMTAQACRAILLLTPLPQPWPACGRGAGKARDRSPGLSSGTLPPRHRRDEQAPESAIAALGDATQGGFYRQSSFAAATARSMRHSRHPIGR
jgi:hypothetical protein